MAGNKGRAPGLEQRIAEGSSRITGMSRGASGERPPFRQRIGTPRTMPRAGVNTRQAAPRKNKRSAGRG